MNVSSTIYYVLFVIAAVSFFMLVLDPLARRAAAEVQAYRERLANVRGGGSAPHGTMVASWPEPATDGGLAIKAALLGLFFSIVLSVSVPLNVNLLASALEWALNRQGRPLAEFGIPFSDEIFVLRETHVFASLLSCCLMIFSSAFAHASEERAISRQVTVPGDAVRGGRWWPALLLCALLLVFIFEASVATLGGYFRSGEQGSEAWLLAGTNGALAVITALGEVVGGFYFIHRFLLNGSNALARGVSRLASRTRKFPRHADPSRPSAMTFALAGIDAVIGPFRQLDRWVIAWWQSRRQPQGGQS